MDELIVATLEYEAANKATNVDIKAYLEDNHIIKGKDLLEYSFNQTKHATNKGCIDENIESLLYHARFIKKLHESTNLLELFTVPNGFTVLAKFDSEHFDLIINYLENSIKQD